MSAFLSKLALWLPAIAHGHLDWQDRNNCEVNIGIPEHGQGHERR
jgi:hypothetical protein